MKYLAIVIGIIAVGAGVAAAWYGGSPTPGMASPPEQALSAWNGTLTVRTVLPKPPMSDCGGGGVKVRVLRADVVWRETRSVAVVGGNGERVGRIVVLEDDGSSWGATASGSWVEECERGGWIETESGFGSDYGVLAGGLVYFSADPGNDPLSDVLPDGTYVLQGPFNLQWDVTTTMVLPDEVRTNTHPVSAPYWIGRLTLTIPPGTTQWQADDLRALVEMVEQQDWQSNPWLDGERRTVEPGVNADERMVGEYRRWIDDQVWLQVAWDLERSTSRTADDCDEVEMSASLRLLLDAHRHPVVESSIEQTDNPLLPVPVPLRSAAELGMWLQGHAHAIAGIPTIDTLAAPPGVQVLDCRVSNEPEIGLWFDAHRHLRNPGEVETRKFREWRPEGTLPLEDVLPITGVPVRASG